MSAGRIAVVRRGAIAEIRIDNPAKLNAMSLAMWQQLAAVVRESGADAGIRLLVLRGEGEKAFVSGADISEFAATRSAESGGSGTYDGAVEAAQCALLELAVPTVARLRGVCMGGGLGLAMSCDLRYASVTTRLRMPAARLGLGYSYSGIERMVAVLGPSRVSDLFFTARTFEGREAERLGIVDRCHGEDEFEEEFERTIAQIAENAPLTLRLAKRAIRLATSGAAPEALADLESDRRRCVESRDYTEGRRAFAEKRIPRFIGE